MRVDVRIPIRSGLLLAVVAIAAFSYLRLTHHEVSPPPPDQERVPVVTASVQQRDFPILLRGLGTVQALNAAVVRSQVTGLLQSVDFTEGQSVRRGDVLAQIDPRPERAQLEQAQAQLARDQAQLANLQVNLGRNVPLLRQGFATDQQVADQKAQVAELEGAIKGDRAAMDNAQAQLSYTTLAAPFDGVTGIRTLDVGNIIHPTDVDGIVVITQVQPISVIFTLPTADIPQVQSALAEGDVKAVALNQTGMATLDTGRLLLINNQADPATGTVQLKALFPNQLRRLWPGAFVNVQLTASVTRDALTIPTNAVQEGPHGNFVFVVKRSQTVTITPVEVAERNQGVAVIKSGLKPGETVVVQGQYRLVQGTAVVAAAPGQIADTSPATSGLLP
jgi:multidrug efflux system membrane fusion protein